MEAPLLVLVQDQLVRERKQRVQRIQTGEEQTERERGRQLVQETVQEQRI